MPEPNTGCWLWIGGKDGSGHGMFHVGKGRYRRAHHLCFEIFVCAERDRDVVRTCGERLCCNPLHLKLEVTLTYEMLLSYKRDWQRNAVASRPEYRKQKNETGKRSYRKHIDKRRLDARTKARLQKDLTRAYVLKKNYGLTPSDVERMAADQRGLCAVCGVEFGRAPQTRMCVDHCHSSGRVRGLLCTLCNLGIGNFRDDESRFRSAIDYLAKHKTGER